ERGLRARLGGVSGGAAGGSPAAGVLVPLCSVRGEPSLLLTLRSSKLGGRHQGDVSFPGGKRDPSDPDIIHTALRETHEELGLKLARDCVWGYLKPLSDRSGMKVVPVLANLGPIDLRKITPNPNEVEDVFAISLSHFFPTENRRYTTFRHREGQLYTLPVFPNAKYKVWGLTAVMIDGLLGLLFPRVYRSATLRGVHPGIGR
ncbi:nucleoside diphosphate-linked moiety X motif 8, partial [Carcharodon carcharias]|uniref:nucleoside diphosphate-linked moiety X motif 8 n=1 Tax=Carcharodon carcharias TaxID=13397 RepID=UPI001B7DB1C5